MATRRRLSRLTVWRVNVPLRGRPVEYRSHFQLLHLEVLELRDVPDASGAATLLGALSDPAEARRVVTFEPRNIDPARGVFPTAAQVRTDLDLVRAAGVSGISLFGSYGLEEVARQAKEAGIRYVIGGVYAYDLAQAEQEILAVVAMKSYLDAVVVGSEALLEDRLTITQLREMVSRVKELTGLPVTTSESIDQYLKHPELLQLGDFVYPNIHPWFASIRDPIEGARYVAREVAELRVLAGPDRLIVVREAWWPTGGGDPAATQDNQLAFLQELERLSIPVLGGDMYDQPWKTAEGSQGPTTALNDNKGAPKKGMVWLQSLLAATASGVITPVTVSLPELAAGIGSTGNPGVPIVSPPPAPSDQAESPIRLAPIASATGELAGSEAPPGAPRGAPSLLLDRPSGADQPVGHTAQPSRVGGPAQIRALAPGVVILAGSIEVSVSFASPTPARGGPNNTPPEPTRHPETDPVGTGAPSEPSASRGEGASTPIDVLGWGIELTDTPQANRGTPRGEPPFGDPDHPATPIVVNLDARSPVPRPTRGLRVSTSPGVRGGGSWDDFPRFDPAPKLDVAPGESGAIVRLTPVRKAQAPGDEPKAEGPLTARLTLQRVWLRVPRSSGRVYRDGCQRPSRRLAPASRPDRWPGRRTSCRPSRKGYEPCRSRRPMIDRRCGKRPRSSCQAATAPAG